MPPPAPAVGEQLRVLAARLADGHLAVPTSTRIVRPRLPPVAAASTGMRSCSSSSRTAGLVALPDLEGRRRDGEHARAADEHGLQAGRAARPVATTCSSSSGTRRRRTCGRSSLAWPLRLRAARRAPARRCRIRRSISASPMHEPRPSETSTWPGTPETASSPIRTMVSDAVISSEAQTRQQQLDAALVGNEQEGHRSSPRPRRRGWSPASARCRPPSAWPAEHGRDERAEHVGRGRRAASARCPCRSCAASALM